MHPPQSTNRWLSAIAASVLFLSTSLSAQNLSLIPVRKDHVRKDLAQKDLAQKDLARLDNARLDNVALDRRDQPTQWNLSLKKDVVIHSPLLRLRDVVEPADPSSPWWERSGEAIIGLMPLDNHAMVIDRNRLIEAMARSSAIPAVQWSGADEVRVTFRRLLEEQEDQTAQTAGPGTTTSRDERPEASYDSQTQPVSTLAKSSGKLVSVKPAMTPTERERVAKLIQYAIDRYDVRLRDAFEIQIDGDQKSIEKLTDLRRVDTVHWETTPSEGNNVAKVIGVNSREPITASVDVVFSARPLVVVARDGLRRGQIISEADVELIPAARNVSTNDVITNIDDAIGFQVQTTLAKMRPIARSSIAPVTVIERGDLVELVVVGGGISVATAAKSLAPGAQGDLIPIETLEPRRKLMARVAGPGQVEILTRPPRVQ